MLYFNTDCPGTEITLVLEPKVRIAKFVSDPSDHVVDPTSELIGC